MLSDFPNNTVASAFDAFDDERKVNRRVTIVIDRDGVIRGRYDDPRDFAGHASEALKVLASLR